MVPDIDIQGDQDVRVRSEVFRTLNRSRKIYEGQNRSRNP